MTRHSLHPTLKLPVLELLGVAAFIPVRSRPTAVKNTYVSQYFSVLISLFGVRPPVTCLTAHDACRWYVCLPESLAGRRCSLYADRRKAANGKVSFVGMGYGVHFTIWPELRHTCRPQFVNGREKKQLIIFTKWIGGNTEIHRIVRLRVRSELVNQTLVWGVKRTLIASKRSKLRTINLIHVFPGSVRTWSLKISWKFYDTAPVLSVND